MATLLLPARSDRAAAEVILQEAVAGMGDDQLVVDGSQVEQVGQAMLQVLVSLRRTGAGARIGGSPALVEAARLTGLHDTLFGELG